MAYFAKVAGELPDVQFVHDSTRRNADGRGGDDNGFRISVRLFLGDPDHKAAVTDAATVSSKWHGRPSHCVAIMKSESLVKVVEKVRETIPAGRTVRAIYGAL